jgi:uncharacterized membrane protein
MPTNNEYETTYTEQDSERVRQAERGFSSAGVPTQRLTQHDLQVPSARRNHNMIGLAMILFGFLLLLVQPNMGRLDIEGSMVFLTIASCFLFFSFWKHIYGLLIPGCILAGLSVGVAFVDITAGASVLFGLSAGFLAILFLGRALFRVDSPWPIFPAVPLFAVGLINAISSLPGFLSSGFLIWLPLLLILAGLYLGFWRGKHQ